MATDILEIYNLALTRLGEDRLAAITDDNENRHKLDAIYDSVLEQVTVAGPEKGWKFAKVKSVNVNVESSTISSIADYSGTVSGTILVTTSSVHNLVSGNYVSIEDTTNYDDEYEATVVSTTTFYVTATFGVTETGTAYWVSDQNQWRFPIPSASKRVVEARVSGIELTDWTEEDGYILTALESVSIDIDYVKSVTTTTLFPSHFTKVLYLSLALELTYSIIQSSAHTERIFNELDIAMSKAIGLDEQKKHVEESSAAWVDAGR
jgi:hypothetical protein